MFQFKTVLPVLVLLLVSKTFATQVLENGAVDGTVEATTFAHDNTYYYNRGRSIYATHGYGPVLYAGAEMIRLLQNDKLDVSKAEPNRINSTFHYRLKSEWPITPDTQSK